MKRKNNAVRLIAAGGMGVLLILAAAAFIVIYTGGYNVAATEEHASITRWTFDTTFHNSVRRRAEHVTAPDPFPAAMIEAGAGEYAAMCEHCHGGPGVDRASWASGMRPRPPHLAEAAAEWTTEEVFWLAKHGVKMTGMPAFGPTHDDRALWSLAGFVKELPAMTPERYSRLRDASGNHQH